VRSANALFYLPVSLNRQPSNYPTPLRKLIILTAIVLAVHALVLGGIPPGIGMLMAPAPDPQALRLSVVTRTPAPVQPVVATVPAPTPAPRPPPVKTRKAVVPIAPPKADAPSPAAAESTASNTPAAPTASEAVNAAPAALPEVPATPVATADPPSAAASAPQPVATPEAAPVAIAPRPQKLAYAPPVLLVFDGKGEERGFIKYAASGELLWAPDGSRYNARLEISAWGFRVRSWSSKGDLTESGLQPQRFGDKPRGAELATHFQRDKGIISFSANNPDVPLQTGAQDKLSALLQLSAIVAGEPERYTSGTTITFQAADAHRAELWNFRIGSLESLDLPGGTLTALKLSKEPTLEFDQRIEVWLAPELRYMPVRLRITEANGAFADLLWRKTEKAE
jgi:hypothetical protein